MFTSGNSGIHRRRKRSIRQMFATHWDPGIFLIGAGLVTAFILVVLSLMFPAEAGSLTLPGERTAIKPSEVRQGSLLFKSEGSGQYAAAPQLGTEVKIEVTGMIAFARVIQEFENPGDQWLEGTYVFPLPEDAAVSRLTMDVGSRVIAGVVKEREEARRTYTSAKEEGRKVSLLEQERPNIFTMSVANIGPGEIIRVELEYQQSVQLDNGIFSLRFPTVVGPRYIPGRRIDAENGDDEENLPGWASATDEVTDAPRITPPVVKPGEYPVNPVSLEVILSPGFNLSRLQSLYHGVDVYMAGDDKALISLNSTRAIADRDFVLQWVPAEDRIPRAAFFTEEKAGEHFIYLMVMPPAAEAAREQNLPREVIFVIDVSGSMAGASIRQAKEALAYGVSRLQPEDRFNIISFNNRVEKLFSYPQTGTGEHIRKGRRYIAGLEASGSTEIRPALYEALDNTRHLNRLRQVIFLTDGCVGNEQQLFQTVRERLGDTRLFTVGIGSAPNSYFMRNIAARGKGTFTYIGNVSEVKTRMQELFLKLENPLLADIRIAGLATTDAFPEPLPDLYLGEPLTLVAKTGEVPDRLLLSGTFAGKYWETEIDARSGEQRHGIATLWARQKIKALMDSLDGGADRDQVRSSVVATALKHQLVSGYTSLVAVDVTPSRPDSENLGTETAGTNMPLDWQYDGVFGLPQAGTAAELCLVLGMLALLLAAIIRFLLKREKVMSWEDGNF